MSASCTFSRTSGMHRWHTPHLHNASTSRTRTSSWVRAPAFLGGAQRADTARAQIARSCPSASHATSRSSTALASMSKKIHCRLDAKCMMDYVDKDTIGVSVNLGAHRPATTSPSRR
jgi:hypothetical protein